MGNDPSSAITTYIFKEHTVVYSALKTESPLKGIVYLKESLSPNIWFTLDAQSLSSHLEDAQACSKDILVKPIQKVILPHFLPFQSKAFQSSELFIKS